jgi:GGDEF domain-containing protein
VTGHRSSTDTELGSDASGHRSFNELAEHEISTADRGGTSLDLLYLDVDAFKEINDRCGHVAEPRSCATAEGRVPVERRLRGAGR